MSDGAPADPLRVAVAGVGGRMGRQLAAAVRADAGMQLVAGTVRPGSPLEGHDLGGIAGGGEMGVLATSDVAVALRRADALVDFTTPAATLAHLEACVATGVAAVVGTTGLDEAATARLRQSAAAIPVVFAANMSVGVNLLLSVLPTIARALAEGYDIEVIEAHHRHKKDAPSGTALRLAEAVAAARGVDLRSAAVHGRSGIAPRGAGQIGMHALRAGGIVGEHTVLFASEGEQVEVRHRAYSRQTFALGALRAARWVVGRPPGLYSMRDVLSIGESGVT